MLFHEKETLLLMGVNERNMAAFGEVFHMYYPALCYFAKKILKDDETTKDIVQDAFTTLWAKFVRFDSMAALKSHLYTSVYRSSINFLNRQNKKNDIVRSLYEEGRHYEEFENIELQIETDVMEIIFSTIALLPTECQRIFRLSYIENLDTKEICDYLGISETTVKTQRSRAKKTLKMILQKYRFEK